MLKLKNRKQIDGIRISCKLLAETFEIIREQIVPGISTYDINRIAEEYIVKKGGRPSFKGYMNFPATACISINHEVIHGIPHPRRILQEGDIVGVDIGIDLNGFFSDKATTFAVGKISPEAEKLMKVTEECLYLGIKKAKVGNRINDISKAVYDHATKHKYGVVHSYCGHGVGFSQHEDPQVPNYVGRGPNPRLKAGMVLALEPMINIGTAEVEVAEDDWTVETLDYELSAHFEHTIALFPDHTEILTKL